MSNRSNSAQSQTTSSDGIDYTRPVKTSYESREVTIPDDFMTSDPADSKPVTAAVIDWEKTVFPEHQDRYAVVLDHVLSPSECQTLLRLAEDSVLDRGKDEQTRWRPALVNIGNGYETLMTDYRRGDRIIWDNQVIVDRLWARCETAPGIKEKLSVVIDEPTPKQSRLGIKHDTWKFSRVNNRMRFLKYQGGEFFRPHCDGAYHEVKNGKVFHTHYTIHLYLNDSVAEAGDSAELVGGATSFLSRDETRKIDVNPKAGRVLIFQHEGLYHSGDDVLKGTKYTMRTDIMYELEEK